MTKFICCLILTILTSSVYCQSIGSEQGCAFRSDNKTNSPIECKPNQCLPFKPDPIPAMCPQYSNLSCCNAFQSTQINNSYTLLSQVFGKCPSCLDNLLNLFCAINCDPSQSTFVTDSGINNSSGTPYVTGITLTISPKYAQEVYLSCKYIEYNGLTIQDAYNDYPDFFGFISSFYTLNIQFAFQHANSLALEAEPCNTQCSCQHCYPACSNDNNNSDNNVCVVNFWGRDWECVTLAMTSAYLAVALLGFAGVVLMLVAKSKSESNNVNVAIRAVGGIQDESTKPKSLTVVQRYWERHAYFVVKRPYLVVFLSLVITGGLGAGIVRLRVDNVPSNLWVPADSRALTDKAQYDAYFQPFYRVNQLIVTAKSGSVFDKDLLLELLSVQQQIEAIKVVSDQQSYGFQEVCYGDCLVESILEFWQGNPTKLQDTVDIYQYLDNCLDNLIDKECTSRNGDSMGPYLDDIFGGFNANESDYLSATALVVTYPLNNYPNNLTVAMLWEEEFLKIAGSKYDTFNLAYSSGRSFQDELIEETVIDIPTVLLCYLAMFIYLTFTLGDIFPLRRFWRILVNTKLCLALGALFTLGCSLVITTGLCCIMGLNMSVLSSDVLPFLSIAIGLDNMYILVSSYQSVARKGIMNPETHLAGALRDAGTSITLASLCESMAFLLAAVTRVPALVSLSIFAGLLVFFNFLLQVTLFCAIMVIDGERAKDSRTDCIPCVKIQDKSAYESDPLISHTYGKRGLLRGMIEKYFAPLILHPLSKILVLFFFIGLLFIGINYSVQIEAGMEPAEILPKDSYLVKYYTEVEEYSESGQPIFVVIREGFDYGNIDSQNEICTLSNCNNNSLLNTFVNAQYVQGPVYSWLDDYLNYAMSDCCYQRNGVRCGRNITGCSPCFNINETTLRPSAEEFYTYLPWFLNLTSPTERCLLYGSPYISDVVFSSNETYGNTSAKLISTSRFLVHQEVLKTQKELISAVKMTYDITDSSKVPSYPYSPLYIYFEPYLELEEATVMIMLVTLAAVFIATIIFLSNPWTSILVILTICMIIVDLMGVMRLWNVTLNAVSLVNLVMAIGISAQFCVHIAFAFLQVENGSRTQRAIVALTDMGTPVICGVSMTKLCGVIAFVFTQSEMFHIYYFIMYLALIILGMAHGVIFLPVLLSLFGTEYGKWMPFTVKKKEFRY